MVVVRVQISFFSSWNQWKPEKWCEMTTIQLSRSVGSTPVLIFDNFVKDVIIVFLDEQDSSGTLREHAQTSNWYMASWAFPPLGGDPKTFWNPLLAYIYIFESKGPVAWYICNWKVGQRNYTKNMKKQHIIICTFIDVIKFIWLYIWSIYVPRRSGFLYKWSIHFLNIRFRGSWRVGMLSTLRPTWLHTNSAVFAIRSYGATAVWWRSESGQWPSGKTSLSFFMKNGGCLDSRHQLD